MSSPIQCLACGETVTPADLRGHLEHHMVATADLEELLQTIRAETITDVATAAGSYRGARETLDSAVATSRATGASWTEIGKAAGITRQAARERWSR